MYTHTYSLQILILTIKITETLPALCRAAIVMGQTHYIASLPVALSFYLKALGPTQKHEIRILGHSLSHCHAGATEVDGKSRICRHRVIDFCSRDPDVSPVLTLFRAKQYFGTLQIFHLIGTRALLYLL